MAFEFVLTCRGAGCSPPPPPVGPGHESPQLFQVSVLGGPHSQACPLGEIWVWSKWTSKPGVGGTEMGKGSQGSGCSPNNAPSPSSAGITKGLEQGVSGATVCSAVSSQNYFLHVGDGHLTHLRSTAPVRQVNPSQEKSALGTAVTLSRGRGHLFPLLKGVLTSASLTPGPRDLCAGMGRPP